MSVEIIIPGQPIPNARARRGRGGNWYTPPATAEYRERVRVGWMVHGRRNFGAAPLEVSAEFVFAHSPSNLRKDGTPRKGAPSIPNADADNLVKGALDALQGLAFDNDRQVDLGGVTRRFCEPGEEPHTVLSIRAAVAA